VRAGVLWRFEFVRESSGGLTPLNISKEDEGQTTSKGDEGRSHPVEVKFIRKNLGLFHRSCPGATSSRNSLWRICEVARTVGFQ
jgi:hypothetical protein